MKFLDQFNDTEILILDLFLKGKSYKEIAFDLGCHIQTVYHSVNVIYMRFGLKTKSREELMKVFNNIDNNSKTKQSN